MPFSHIAQTRNFVYLFTLASFSSVRRLSKQLAESLNTRFNKGVGAWVVVYSWYAEAGLNNLAHCDTAYHTVFGNG